MFTISKEKLINVIHTLTGYHYSLIEDYVWLDSIPKTTKFVEGCNDANHQFVFDSLDSIYDWSEECWGRMKQNQQYFQYIPNVLTIYENMELNGSSKNNVESIKCGNCEECNYWKSYYGL